MNKSNNKLRIFSFIATILLLVFASCISFTGSWFTDSKTFQGGFEAPVIQPTIVYKNNANYVAFSDTYYWSSSSDNKDVYLKFDTNNNVNYQLARVRVNVEWGTYDNGTFTLQTLSPVQAMALLPNYDSWVAGESTIDYDAVIAQFLTDEGLSEEEFNEMLADLEMTREQFIADLVEDDANSVTNYYYNGIINVSSLTNGVLRIFNGLAFADGYTASDFAGLTARITFSVEAESVSDRVIGVNGTWTSGEEKPTNEWLTLINSQKSAL